jgi:hypothetical protein
MGHVLTEYPLAVVGLLEVPWSLASGAGGVTLFEGLFCVGALIGDGWFLSRLTRSAGPAKAALPVRLWLYAMPAMGSLAYARFDLLPGILVGCAVLWLANRPRAAAAALAVATAVKLWPALLIPTLLLGSARRRAALAVTTAVGGVTVLATVVLAGPSRVFSPLAYQAHRGLQIESVVATPLMLHRLTTPPPYRVFYSTHLAYEIIGPGAAVLTAATTLLSLVLLAGLLLTWTCQLRRGAHLGPDAVVWMLLSATTGFICAGKVLSPQYFLWLLPAAVAGLVVVEATREALTTWTAGLLLATALSHALCPWLYGGLVVQGSASPVAVGVLTLRNLLLLLLLTEACRQSFHALRLPSRETPARSLMHSSNR